jgi:hypothetical protein
VTRARVLAAHRARGLPDQSHEFFFASKNEGRRSAERRNCPVGPRHAADVATPLRFGRSRASCAGRARLSALHRGSRRAATRSASGRVSWNYRVQTGGPSPAPVQRAPRGPVTCRPSGAPKPPGCGLCRSARERRARFRNQEHPHDGVPSQRAARFWANTDGAVKRKREMATLRPCNSLEHKSFCAISQNREVMAECCRCRRSHGSPQRFASP